MAFSALKAHTYCKQKKADNLLKANSYFNQRLSLKALFVFAMRHKARQVKANMNKLKKVFQLKYLFKPLWEVWKQEVIMKLDGREKEEKAVNTYVENLVVKSFAILKQITKLNRVKRKKHRKAEHFIYCRLLKKTLNRFRCNIREMKAIKYRNSKLMNIIHAIKKRIVIKILKDLLNYARMRKEREDALSELNKIAVIKYKALTMFKLKEYTKTKARKELNKQASIKHYNNKTTQRFFELWFTSFNESKANKEMCNKLTSIYNARILQRVINEWKELYYAKKALKIKSNYIKNLLKYRLVKECWIKWLHFVIYTSQEQSMITKVTERYTETLIIKAFASLKFNYREKKLIKEKEHKADSLYFWLMGRKIFTAWELYNAKQRKRFELSRKITQIDVYNLKAIAFQAFYAWFISKRRRIAGYKVLRSKHTFYIMKRLFVRWSDISKVKRNENTQQYNLAQRFYTITLLNKTLKGLRGEVNVGAGRLKREVFLAWKKMADERRLFNRYLKQCNIEEQFTSKSMLSHRFDAPRLHKAISSIKYNQTRISPRVLELSHGRLGAGKGLTTGRLIQKINFSNN